ncbi:MAG: CHAD domain-containing protein [Acidobacteriales bacterium]|nr:CHAD domain-containing protein [Terriglobales bacterium]
MRAYAAEQMAGRLTRLVFEVRRAVRNRRPDDVHDLRVAIRRFSECLSVFRKYIPSGAAKKCHRRLRRIMDLAAVVRNHDITIELLSLAGVGQRSALYAWLAGARGKAMENLADELSRLNRRDFSRRWRESLELSTTEATGGSTPGLDAPASYASKALPEMARKFFKRGRRAAAAGKSRDALHQFRLASKRFRYSVELFRPVYGPGLVDRLSALRTVQQHLGGVSDCASACELLDGAPAGSLRSAEAAKRRIEALGERRMRAFRQYWKRSFDSPLVQSNWTAYLSRFAGRRKASRRS